MANVIDGEGGKLKSISDPTNIDKNLDESKIRERTDGLLRLFEELLAKKEQLGREIHVANKALTQHYKDYFASGENYPEVESYINILERIIEGHMEDLKVLEKQLGELNQYAESLLGKIQEK